MWNFSCIYSLLVNRVDKFEVLPMNKPKMPTQRSAAVAIPADYAARDALGINRETATEKNRSTVRALVSFLMLAFLLLMLAMVNANAAGKINTLEKTGLFGKFVDTGIAIRGYDTVAYFTESKPTEGMEQFSVDWNGASWLFASQENADLFTASPEKYAPQYGGYCAYGVAMDYLVKIEPDQWAIVDGKLYLNYDKKVQKLWRKDVPGFIQSANGKFDGLLQSSK